MSEDTGNAKFVQNYNREIFLEKSLFWVEEPGCSSRTQKPAHQSADFSAKQGVTPGGNDLELFLGQSWVSSQKMGSVSRKTKNATFFAFYQNPENIQRGDPWAQKNSKCSDLDETCRTGGDHQKNKLGSDFEVCLHLVGVWATKNEKWCKGGTLGTKKIQSAPIWTKFAGLVGGIKKISWVVILKCSCTLLRSEGSKKKVFVTKSGGFGEKKTPKVEDWKSILIEILTFEKKTTKSGGFSSFEEKSILRNHQKWRFFRF